MNFLLKISLVFFLVLHSISGLSQKLTFSAGYSPISFSRGHNLDGIHLHGLNITAAYDISSYSALLCTEAIATQNTETKEMAMTIFFGGGFSFRLFSQNYSRYQPVVGIAFLNSISQANQEYIDLKSAVLKGELGLECFLTNRLAIVPKIQLNYWQFKETFKYYLLSPVVSLQYTL